MEPPPDLYPATPDMQQVWASAAWRAEITAWATDELASLGVRVLSGPAVHKLRPWAVVQTLETDAGRLFLKTNCPGQAFEARLVALLAELASGRTIPPTAVDARRDFLLTADQGPVLGEQDAQDVDTWCRVVAEWAELQRLLVPYAARLAEVGVAVHELAHLPDLVRRRAAALAALPKGDPRRLDDDDAARVRAGLPRVEAHVQEASALGLPLTLSHNDLHANNVFVPAPDRPLEFFDLADAVVSEPLAALLVPLNVLGHQLEAGPDDPRLRRVADAFLEVWSDLVPAKTLRATLPAALTLGRIARHESWMRVLPSLTGDDIAEYGDAAAYWLGSTDQQAPVSY